MGCSSLLHNGELVVPVGVWVLQSWGLHVSVHMWMFQHAAIAVGLINMWQAKNGTWCWLLFGQKLVKESLVVQVWCNKLPPFLSLLSALCPLLAGSQLFFLLCSAVHCACPTICQWIPLARRVPAAATQERRSRKFQARQRWPVQLARGLSPRGAGWEKLLVLDLVSDYTYILISGMLTLKI